MFFPPCFGWPFLEQNILFFQQILGRKASKWLASCSSFVYCFQYLRTFFWAWLLFFASLAQNTLRLCFLVCFFGLLPYFHFKSSVERVGKLANVIDATICGESRVRFISNCHVLFAVIVAANLSASLWKDSNRWSLIVLDSHWLGFANKIFRFSAMSAKSFHFSTSKWSTCFSLSTFIHKTYVGGG